MTFQRNTDRPNAAPLVQGFGFLYIGLLFALKYVLEQLTGGLGPDARVHVGALGLLGGVLVMVGCWRLHRSSLATWADTQVAAMEKDLGIVLAERSRVALRRAFSKAFPSSDHHWVVSTTDGTKYLVSLSIGTGTLRPFEFTDAPARVSH
jgi:hypothetical protein